MGFLRAALWFIVVFLAFGLAKLLFDNILYAAIMRQLESAFGIKEGDVVAVIASNLIPLFATMIVVALIWWLTLQHHRKVSLSAGSVPAPTPPPIPNQNSRVRQFFSRKDRCLSLRWPWHWHFQER